MLNYLVWDWCTFLMIHFYIKDLSLPENTHSLQSHWNTAPWPHSQQQHPESMQITEPHPHSDRCHLAQGGSQEFDTQSVTVVYAFVKGYWLQPLPWEVSYTQAECGAVLIPVRASPSSAPAMATTSPQSYLPSTSEGKVGFLVLTGAGEVVPRGAMKTLLLFLTAQITSLTKHPTLPEMQESSTPHG